LKCSPRVFLGKRGGFFIPAGFYMFASPQRLLSNYAVTTFMAFGIVSAFAYPLNPLLEDAYAGKIP
jgi:hypothetical protein